MQSLSLAQGRILHSALNIQIKFRGHRTLLALFAKVGLVYLHAPWRPFQGNTKLPPPPSIGYARLGPSAVKHMEWLLTWPAIRRPLADPLYSSSSSLSLDGRLEARPTTCGDRAGRKEIDGLPDWRNRPLKMRLTNPCYVGSISGLPNNTLEIAALISVDNAAKVVWATPSPSLPSSS